MITLAIDTSTARGAVALLRDENLLAEQNFSRTAGVAASVPDASPGGAPNLYSAVESMLSHERLSPRDIELFAVGTGPGSFTGIRVGIAAAKGLALPSSRPIKAVSSFDAIALAAAPKMPRDCPQFCVLCDARRDEIYFAFYERTGYRTGEIQLGTLDSVADAIHNPIWFVSPDIERFRNDLTSSLGGFASVCETPLYPSAAALGWLAVQRFRADGNRGDSGIEPIYLRAPEYKKS